MKQNTNNRVLFGAHIGEHGVDKEQILHDIKVCCVDRGMNFVIIRTPRNKAVEPEFFLEWAQYLKDNKVYFMFLYTIQHAPADRISQFTPELVTKIREIAGEYFLGDMLGELGCVFCGKLPGYYVPGHPPMPPQNVADMQEGKDNYLKAVHNFVDIEKSLGMDKVGIAVVEHSALISRNMEAGVTVPFEELMGWDPEPCIAAARGAARAYDSPYWGAYFAHEWYAGFYHTDELKQKRLELEYRYAYMSGAGALCHESGDERIRAYGRDLERDSEVSTKCRNFINSFADYLKNDEKPAGQPVTKVAFMYGNLDCWRGASFGCFCWSQFEGEQWGYNEPEWSWKILQEIGKKYKWSESNSFACHGKDHSGQAPYGNYDIIPTEASVELMKQYDTIIYAGWNTMTEEQMEKLEAFVESGGTLLMSAAHLNTETRRDGDFLPIRGGDVSRLFGCKLTGGTLSNNYGMKFRTDSMVDGFLYPWSLNSFSDPQMANGFVDYGLMEVCGGTVVATIEDSFHFLDKPGVPAVIENRLGKGVAILMGNVNYPGRDASYPLFKFMVRELLRVGVSKAKVRVVGPDALRYSVYPDGTVYLLNTDYDCTFIAEIIGDGYHEKVELAPMEIKNIKTGILIQ